MSVRETFANALGVLEAAASSPSPKQRFRPIRPVDKERALRDIRAAAEKAKTEWKCRDEILTPAELRDKLTSLREKLEAAGEAYVAILPYGNQIDPVFALGDEQWLGRESIELMVEELGAHSRWVRQMEEKATLGVSGGTNKGGRYPESYLLPHLRHVYRMHTGVNPTTYEPAQDSRGGHFIRFFVAVVEDAGIAVESTRLAQYVAGQLKCYENHEPRFLTIDEWCADLPAAQVDVGKTCRKSR
jgi:hypothetical protein